MGQVTQRMMILGWLLAVFALLGLGGCKGDLSDKKIEFIDLNRAMELYEEGQGDSEAVLFIDVRKHERFAEGRIEGARNIRVNEIDLKYDADPELLKYDNLVVYGENPGSASARAMAKRMIQGGYNTMLKDRVRLFLGGWVVWESTGLPFDVDPDVESDDADMTGEEE